MIKKVKIINLENTKKYLKKIIKHNDLLEFEDEFFSLAKETIIFKKFEPDNYLELGNTRFGGYPDLPEDFLWPKNKDGKYFDFISQINLKDLIHFGTNLPKVGILYFFDGDKLSSNAHYSKKSSRIKKSIEKEGEEFYQGFTTFTVPYKVFCEQTLTLPESILEVFENSKINQNTDVAIKYDKIKEKLDKYNGKYLASMFGYITNFEYEIRNSSPDKFKDEPILLFVDSDIGGTDFCFGDSGVISYLIKEKDLIKRRFSSILLTGYCS